LFQDLHGGGRSAPVGSGDQQVDLSGHEDIADHDEAVALPRLFEDGEEAVTRPLGIEQGQSAVTRESDKV